MPSHAISRSTQAAHREEDECFGHELPNQPTAARAKRVTDCQLALTRSCLREQKIRDVGARDQQKKEDGTEKHIERRAHATGDRSTAAAPRRVGEKVVALLLSIADDVLRDSTQLRGGLPAVTPSRRRPMAE